jgi:hypothetical protein
MAAMTATLVVSIRISARSKPANIVTFDMGTSLSTPTPTIGNLPTAAEIWWWNRRLVGLVQFRKIPGCALLAGSASKYGPNGLVRRLTPHAKLWTAPSMVSALKGIVHERQGAAVDEHNNAQDNHEGAFICDLQIGLPDTS